MGRSRWAHAIHYSQHGRGRHMITERVCASECLWWYEVTLNQRPTRITHPRHTSIMTIAKEKISASLLYVPCSFRISGAVHRAVCPLSSDPLRMDSKLRVTVARPKSVIRA